MPFMKNIIHILSVLLIVSNSQANMTKRSPTPCMSKDITNLDLSKCTCVPRETSSTCSHICNFQSGKCTSPPTSKKVNTTSTCGKGCLDADVGCEGCSLFFHSICDCLKGLSDPSKKASCSANQALPTSHPGSVWIHLPVTSDPLITTNQYMPGIEDMTAKDDGAWSFAQKQFNSGSNALALNSFRSRTQEQIHIHICNRNKATYNLLSNARRENYKDFGSLDPKLEMICRVNDQKNQDISGFAGDIANRKKWPTGCPFLVGAGIMRDKNNYAWACFTYNSRGPLELLCE